MHTRRRVALDNYGKRRTLYFKKRAGEITIVETLVGSTLGGYTLTRFLGSGGMGTVYLAEDKAIGQQVAIKVVRTDDSDYADQMSETFAAERFRQEARAVASLDHLHILPFYRYGEEETPSGRKAYMVMQYRPEGSLWDLIRRRTGIATEMPSRSAPHPSRGSSKSWPLPVEEAADYLCQAASALQYAHDRGIIHRDVKPANFLLRVDQANNTESGVFLLLSDFGLAKFFSASSATSNVFGTPVYMAPEQFEGSACPESDQYSLAVMIYFFLAGNLPFEGDPMRLMHQHLSAKAPPIRTLMPSLSAGIEAVLARALAKKPSARYPSIQAFADDFMQRRHEKAHIVSQFVTPTPAATGLPARNVRISNNVQVATPQPVVSPESQKLVQVKAPPTYPRHSAPTLYPSQPDMPVQQGQVGRRSMLAWLTGGAVALSAGAGIYFYLKSQAPDIQYVPSGSQGNKSPKGYTIFKGHTDEVTSVAWSPDGTLLASAALDHTARLWQPANQQSTVVYQGHRHPLLSIAWSPDSTLLASGGRDNTVQLWNTQGTLTHRYIEAISVNDIAWTPDGRSIFIGTLGSGLREIFLDKNTIAPRGAKAVIRAIAISPDGQLLAVGSETGFIAIFALPELSRMLYRHSHNAPVLSLAWSPDGTMLASGSGDNTAQVLAVQTNTLVRSLPHGSAVRGVAWSNSGRLATGAADGKMRIWSVENGSNTIYTGHTAAINTIAWGKYSIITGSTDKTIILWNT